MPITKSRVVGSGFTTFNYNGTPIAMLKAVNDSGQNAGADGGPAYEAVTLLDSKHPEEIATSGVVSMGTLTVTIQEIWSKPVWYMLAGLDGVGETVTDVYAALNANPQAISCQTLIKPPGGLPPRGKTYMNCTILNIDDSEQITVGALTVARALTIGYTHKLPLT
jgi:hypothetical protein